MNITHKLVRGRKVWELDNGRAALSVMDGGGNISALKTRGAPPVNPLWVPVWKTVEPWQCRKADVARCSCRLLASISGHNLCLSAFGEPSPEETKAGFENHGETTVARWKAVSVRKTKAKLTLAHACTLPLARMKVLRTVSTAKESAIFRVREDVTNLARIDVPFTMCEHVTFGPPFLEKGVTLFDMPATLGHTLPSVFSDHQRLKVDAAFKWPRGPGADGKAVDLRMIGKEFRKNADFSAQLIDARKECAWFSAVNPRQGLLVAYVWRRADFPWLGNWEENFCRTAKPWVGKSLTRGMEFSNTPFAIGLRKAVTMGTFKGESTYRWLPAMSRLTVEYQVVVIPVDKGCRGVADIVPADKGLEIRFRPDASGNRPKIRVV